MIDFTDVFSAITEGVSDFLVGGAILLAAYAAAWGIGQVIELYRFRQFEKNYKEGDTFS